MSSVGHFLCTQNAFLCLDVYYSGYAAMCSLRRPIGDVIMGQLKEVKKCTSGEIQAWYHKQGINANAVTTWAEGKRHKQQFQQEMIENN